MEKSTSTQTRYMTRFLGRTSSNGLSLPINTFASFLKGGSPAGGPDEFLNIKRLVANVFRVCAGAQRKMLVKAHVVSGLAKCRAK